MRRLSAAALALAVAACLHRPQPREASAPAAAAPHIEPDVVGVVHVVKRGETVYRIAKTYGLEPRELMEVNGLSDPRELAVGAELFIPGATRELEPPAMSPKDAAEPAPSTPPSLGPAPARAAQQVALRWPLKGLLYSKYGLRQGQRHDGIDIVAPEGTPVCAAADGTVVYAGQQQGYGEIVIVRHVRDLLTVYAHAGAILVTQGAAVVAGQPIARVGRSGRTTGPHLHFEVREGTRPRNPLLYLP